MGDSSSASDQPSNTPRRLFLTVHEAAEELRVDAVTIYRAIREGGFPAVQIRGRYIVPARAVEALAEEAVALGRCINVADYTLTRKTPDGGG